MTLYIIAMLIPLCNCFAITFLLYDGLQDEKHIVNLYIMSSYFKISAFILTFNYFGIIGLFIYLSIVLGLMIFILIFTYKNENIKKINEQIYITKTSKYLFDNISKFSYRYMIGLLILSMVNSIIPTQYIMTIIARVRDISLFNFFIYSFSKYTCIPNDIIDIASYKAIGMPMFYISMLLFIGIITNIQEIYVFIIYIKNRFKILICWVIFVLLCSVVINYMNDLVVVNMNIDEKIYELLELFNISFSSTIKNISSVIFIVLVLFRIIKDLTNDVPKKFSKNI